MSREQDVVEIEDVACTNETERAILCMIDGTKHWIPKSVVHDDSEVYAKGHDGKLVIQEWFASKEGLGG